MEASGYNCSFHKFYICNQDFCRRSFDSSCTNLIDIKILKTFICWILVYRMFLDCFHNSLFFEYASKFTPIKNECVYVFTLDDLLILLFIIMSYNLAIFMIISLDSESKSLLSSFIKEVTQIKKKNNYYLILILLTVLIPLSQQGSVIRPSVTISTITLFFCFELNLEI